MRIGSRFRRMPPSCPGCASGGIVVVGLFLAGCPTSVEAPSEDPSLPEETRCPEVQPLGFSEPVAIAQTPGNAKTPAIVVGEGDAITVAWHDFSDDPTRIYVADLVEDTWAVTIPDLIDAKAIRPRLVADGARLHLFFDVYEEDRQDWGVYVATREGGVFGAVTRLGSGEKADAALHEGVLHAVWFHEGQLVHRIGEAGSWRDGDPIRVPAYVQNFRLRLLSAEQLSLLVATSPGEVSYDPELFTWTDQGWVSRALYTSRNLSSDEPGGAVGPDGVAHWVWTEQDPVDVWTIGVVTQRSDAASPTWVDATPGFSAAPTLAVPPDGVPLAAWVDPDGRVLAARDPWDVSVVVAIDGLGPQLVTDGCGASHLVFYGRRGFDTPQQVFYSNDSLR